MDIIQYQQGQIYSIKYYSKILKFGINTRTSQNKLNIHKFCIRQKKTHNNLQLTSKIKYMQETQLFIHKKSSECINRNIRFSLT